MRLSIKMLLIIILPLMLSCNQDGSNGTENTNGSTEAEVVRGQEAVQDDESHKDVVKVAVSSPDHTTLVAALKQAQLVSSLSNAGPFTVFAPTNEAFNKLPAGTVDALMKEDKKEDLQDILQYHVFMSALKPDSFTDGDTLGMVNGSKVTVSVKNGVVKLNNSATITTSIPASNGIIYVIDGVLLPTANK